MIFFVLGVAMNVKSTPGVNMTGTPGRGITREIQKSILETQETKSTPETQETLKSTLETPKNTQETHETQGEIMRRKKRETGDALAMTG